MKSRKRQDKACKERVTTSSGSTSLQKFAICREKAPRHPPMRRQTWIFSGEIAKTVGFVDSNETPWYLVVLPGDSRVNISLLESL